MTIQLLLVCEGASDIPIFEAIAEEYSDENRCFNIKVVAPEFDATSGRHETFGWTKVCNWCSANAARIQLLIDFFGSPAFFIQMDTDIAGEIDSNYTSAGISARECCERKLNTELGVDSEPEKCFYILPSQKTETWLLSIHDQNTDPHVFTSTPQNYESLSNVDDLLIQLGYQSNRQNKLIKRPNIYASYAEQLVRHLTTARSRSSELNRLCTIIERL